MQNTALAACSITPPGIAASGGAPDDVKMYRHVIAIPTANGATAQVAADDTTIAP